MTRLPDPVQMTSIDDSGVVAILEALPPHEVERTVLHRLQNHPSLKFSRLCVHQCGHDSIFLDGTLESNEQDIDLCDVVRGIHGIKNVVNRVINTHPMSKQN